MPLPADTLSGRQSPISLSTRDHAERQGVTRELVRMHRIFDIHSTKEEASRAFAR